VADVQPAWRILGDSFLTAFDERPRVASVWQKEFKEVDVFYSWWYTEYTQLIGSIAGTDDVSCSV